MHSPDPSLCEPEPPSENNEGSHLTWRKSVSETFTNLKGWQAIPVAVVALYCLLGIFGPVLAPFGPNEGTVATRLCPPLAMNALATASHPTSRAADCSASNILGTDHIGRDIFSRVLYGAKNSFSVVASSVMIGTIASVVIGVFINGLRPKRRLIAYIIVGTTIVPSGFLLVNQPEILAIFDLIVTQGNSDDDLRWSVLTSFSFATMAFALLLIGVAYQFDDRCRPHWFNETGTERGTHECLSRVRQQVVALAPWIAFTVIAGASLITPRSLVSAFQTSDVRWTLELEYLFEHIGMFSPIVPMAIVPIAFVSFGIWWFVRHLLDRFNPTSKPTSDATASTEVLAEEHSSESCSPTEGYSDQAEADPSDNRGINTSVETAPRMTRSRWVLTIVGIVVATAITRFVVAEAVPISRELAQDWTGDYQSTLSLSVQGRQAASDCANEMSSTLMTLSGLPPEQLDVEPSQRCVDLYYRYRNAPTHRMTSEFALKFLTQSLTLALIGSIVSAGIWTAISTSASALRITVRVFVVLMASTGLTITFAHVGWLLVVERWIDPVDLALSGKGLAVSRALGIIRDFSVALGISYLTIAIASPSLRFGNSVPKIDTLLNWASFLVPCILLTSGLLIVFHYSFPTNVMFYDDHLAVITNPSVDHIYISVFRNWLWTYWFAAIGYVAIVIVFFYAAISGFRRYAINGPSLHEIKTPVSPNSPSQDAGPT